MKRIAALCLSVLCWSATAADIPLGLPSLPPPAVSQLADKQALGKRLFMDSRLSADGSISCATCHLPNKQFADGLTTGKGIGGQRSFRNTPSLLNVAYVNELFWDGRSASLESQLLGPLTNPKEHGLANGDAVVQKVQADASYRTAFAALYAANRKTLDMRDIADAISQYERTLLSANSAFDRYYYGKQQAALSASAQRGLALFTGRARCSTCHLIGEQSALFSDQAFHRSPNSLPESVSRHLSDLAQLVVATKHSGETALDKLTTANPDVAELGRFLVTLNPADIGSFRTPSLRNVALTAPYMHDGSIPTLVAVIDAELYVRGDAGNYPIVLTADERADILAFLQSLNGADR